MFLTLGNAGFRDGTLLSHPSDFLSHSGNVIRAQSTKTIGPTLDAGIVQTVLSKYHFYFCHCSFNVLISLLVLLQRFAESLDCGLSNLSLVDVTRPGRMLYDRCSFRSLFGQPQTKWGHIRWALNLKTVCIRQQLDKNVWCFLFFVI